MNLPEPRSSIFSVRDFINRREPGARWMLLLLIAAAVAEVWVIMISGFRNSSAAGEALTVTGIALVTSRWWSLPSAPAFPETKWEVSPASKRWVWLMAGAITLLAMWPRSVRLNHSLQHDEFEQLDRTTKTESFVRPSYVAASIATDFLGQELVEGRTLNARTIRTFPWLAGILTTGLVVLLASALGSPRAGVAAGLILALHPGHVRWSSELGDEAHGMLFCVAALLCLLNALRTNRWRWWAALAGCEACLLFGDTAAWLPLMNVAGMAVLIVSKASKRDRITHALRMVVALAVAGVVMAIPYVFIIEAAYWPLPLADQWAQLLAKVDWSAPFPVPGAGADMAETILEAGWRGPLLWGLLPLCGLAGLYFMIRQDWRTCLVAVALLPVFLMPNSYMPKDGHMPQKLLLLSLLLAWAGAGLLRLFPGQRRMLHAPLFVAVVYAFATVPILQLTTQIPQQPLRDVAVTARHNATEKGTTAVFGYDAEYAAAFDPAVKRVNTVEEVNALIDVAFEKNLPLFVYRMTRSASDAAWSALNVKLAKSGQFQPAGEFRGFYPRNGYELYRYQSREQIYHIQVKPEKKETPP